MCVCLFVCLIYRLSILIIPSYTSLLFMRVILWFSLYTAKHFRVSQEWDFISLFMLCPHTRWCVWNVWFPICNTVTYVGVSRVSESLALCYAVVDIDEEDCRLPLFLWVTSAQRLPVVVGLVEKERRGVSCLSLYHVSGSGVWNNNNIAYRYL